MQKRENKYSKTISQNQKSLKGSDTQSQSKALILPRQLGCGQFRQSTEGPYHRLEPITFNPVRVFDRKVRYMCSNSIAHNFSIINLFSCDTFAVSTTSTRAVNRAMRIKKVTVWAPCSTQGTPVTATIVPQSVDADNSFAALPESITDTSSDITRPAYIEYTTNVMTPAGAWHYSDGNDSALLALFVPAASIIDIDVQILGSNLLQTTGYTYTVVGATQAVRYAHAPTTGMIPQGVNFI